MGATTEGVKVRYCQLEGRARQGLATMQAEAEKLGAAEVKSAPRSGASWPTKEPHKRSSKAV